MPLCSVGVPLPKTDLDFSIEEIRSQLSALGLTDLSRIQLVQLKRHLDKIIEREKNQLPTHYLSAEPACVERETNSSASDSISTVTDDSCTIRGLSQGSASASSLPRDQAASSGYTQVWQQPGTIKGVPFIPNKPGNMNSNCKSSKAVLKSDHLGSASPFQTPPHRPPVRAPRSQKRMKKLSSQAPFIMSNSSSGSDEQILDKHTKESLYIPLSAHDSEFDKRTTAIESSDLINRHSNGSTPAEHRVRITAANTEPCRASQIGRDDGDFDFISSTDGNKSTPKISSGFSGDPHFRVLGSGTKSGVTQYPYLSMKYVSRVGPTEHSTTSPKTNAGNSPTNGDLTLQKPPPNSVGTESGLLSCPGSQLNGSMSVSVPVRHLKVILPNKEHGLRSAIPTNSQVIYTCKGCNKKRNGYGITDNSEPQILEMNYSTEGSKKNSSRRTSARSRSTSTDRRFKRPSSGGRRSRRRSSSAGRKPKIDTEPERSELKSTSAYPFPLDESFNGPCSFRGSAYTDGSEQSGVRSARFPENPVAKVHEWHSRLSTTSTARRTSCSQSSRSGTGTSRLKKQDPVSRYHSYQRTWLSHLIPGEDSRRTLRWNVKAALMHREVPILQRNLGEVTRLFGPRVAAMLVREHQQSLRALNLDFMQVPERRHSRARYQTFRSATHH